MTVVTGTVTLDLAQLAAALGITLPTVPPAPTPAPSGHIWMPGHWLGSNNVDGTGSGNQAEMNALGAAIKAGIPWVGYMPIYTWRNLENVENVYNFTSTICADFQYLQSVAPGAGFWPMIWSERFSGTTAENCGTPDYILSSSTYGTGQDGSHFGYWPFSFNPPTLSGGSAAVWRSAVQARKILLWQALAICVTDPENRPGETFGTCPLLQGVSDQESSLSLLSGSDYADAGQVAQIEALTSALITAFPQAIVAPMLNYLNIQANAQPLLLSTFQAGAARCGPDCYYCPTGSNPPHLDWFQATFTGIDWNPTTSTWVSGGTDYRGQYVSIGSIQEETIAKYSSQSTPQTSFNTMQYLACSHMIWVYMTTGAYTFNTLGNFLCSNPITNKRKPGNFA